MTKILIIIGWPIVATLLAFAIIRLGQWAEKNTIAEKPPYKRPAPPAMPPRKGGGE